VIFQVAVGIKMKSTESRQARGVANERATRIRGRWKEAMEFDSQLVDCKDLSEGRMKANRQALRADWQAAES
jgi:hypothetical protein